MLTLAKDTISLFEGKTYQIVPHTEKNATFTFVSDNEAVAAVGACGKIRALSPGTAHITITASTGDIKNMTVTVKQKKFVYAAYVPPTPGYATSEQYDYLKEAGINTMIMHGFVPREHMEASLKVGVPRGIQFYVSDDRLSGDIFSYSEDTIRDYIRSYKDREGVYGYFLKDEPIGANPYAPPYRTMIDEDPEKVVHLNFYPIGTVEQFGMTYEGYIDDWVALLGPGYKKTISFDNYPFNKEVYDEEVCMYHFETMHKYARKHDVDVEYFVQAVDLKNSFYCSDESVRYHFSIGLAYGVKSYQYFTWFTPISDREDFVPATAPMTADGKKAKLFDIVKTTNHMVQKIEPFLAPAEAIAVYHTVNPTKSETPLPSDYFFRTTGDENGIVTLYYNEALKKYYILVVNKNYYDKRSTFTFQVKGTNEVYNLTSGTPETVVLQDGKFSTEIEGGLYRLYGFPEGFVPTLPAQPQSEDLALHKPVYVHTSVGKDGFYAMNLTDGDPHTFWAPTEDDTELFALIDLKSIESVGTITLSAAQDFEGKAKISLSQDHVIYETVAEDLPLTKKPQTLSFPETKARYVKITIPNASVRLAQCCVYKQPK